MAFMMSLYYDLLNEPSFAQDGSQFPAREQLSLQNGKRAWLVGLESQPLCQQSAQRWACGLMT